MKLQQDNLVASPQDFRSPENFIDNFIKKVAESIKVCLPAEIISYDRANSICTCKILIREESKSGIYFEFPDLFNIPVSFSEGGGYGINLPLLPGDKGWVVFNDLDISKFKEVLRLQSPNTGRRHDLMDGWFYPTGMRQMTIAAEDSGRAVFQKTDGSVKISMGIDIHIVGDINHDGNLTVNGDAEINGNLTVNGDTDIDGDLSATGSADITQNTTIGGSLAVTGPIISSTSIEAPNITSSGLTVNGIDMTTHRHFANAEYSPTGGPIA